MCAVPIAYPHVAARFVLQHESKVFGAHGRRDIALHPLRADDSLHDLSAELGFGCGVDGGWVFALEVERSLAIKGSSGLLTYRLHARFDEIKRGVGKCAHCA